MSGDWVSTQRATADQKAAEVLRLAGNLTDRFLEDGVISSEDVEIVRYGLENIAGSLSGIIVTLIVSACFGRIFNGLILWGLILPLRRNAGGYHADTRNKCLLISSGMILLAFICMILPGWSVLVYMTIAIFFWGLIFLMAPVGNPNKLLDEIEYRVYRKRTRIVLLMEGVLSVLSWICFWVELSAITASCFFIVGMALIAGRIKLRIYGKKQCET